MFRILVLLPTLVFLQLQARTIEVCASCDVKTLDAAIKIANQGDEILLKKGRYKSVNLNVNKSVSIRGIDFPVLDAENKDDVLLVTADHVSIRGIGVRNSARGTLKDYAGIRADGVKDLHISGVRMVNTFFGIYLSNVEGAYIYGNVMQGRAPDQTSSGNGIHLWKCNRIAIVKNYSSGHRDGIYFEFARNGYIYNNTSVNNHRYGLHFMFSDSNMFLHNRFFYNGTGVAVMYSKNISMLKNEFGHNWGSAAFGMLLKDITDSRIQGNRFINNTTALYFEGSNRVKVDSNEFRENGWALKLLSSCQNDSFVNNNFIANTFDVSTNGTLFLNHFHQNYWEKYDGYDINRDKVGDIPHRPVSMYSIMVEKMPFVLFLMRSFIVDLLDKAEQNIPALIPENVIDLKPRMLKLKWNDRS